MHNGKPFRIQFTPWVDQTEDQLAVNLSALRGYPKAQRGANSPVAVVGGGPSLVDRLEELRGWPGDIWAVNNTAKWLLEQGIPCTLFSVDPYPLDIEIDKALVATCCPPVSVSKVKHVQVFDLAEHAPDGIDGGTTSAVRAAALSIRLGYPGLAYFGCDSSYITVDHVDRDEQRPEELIVRANGKDYRTRPDLLIQAQELSQLIRTFDAYFDCRSGGLLPAMVADDQWEVVGVSPAMKKTLIETNGDSGLYDTPYVPPCADCGQVTGHYDDCPVGLGA